MARGPFKEVAFTDFSGGLNTKDTNNLIEDNQSPDLQNVIFDGKGYIAPRLGRETFGENFDSEEADPSGTATTADTDDGTSEDWTDHANVGSSDDSYATCALPGSSEFDVYTTSVTGSSLDGINLDVNFIGDSFLCTKDSNLLSATVKLKYILGQPAPTGTLYMKLFAHAGTYGSTSVGVGVPGTDELATSDGVAAAGITTNLQEFEFTFSGAEQYNLQKDTHYVIGISNTNTRWRWNCMNTDGSAGTGNGCYYRPSFGAWYPRADMDHWLKVTTSGYKTDHLDLDDFGFSIPSTATINKVEVNIEKKSSVADSLYDNVVQLIIGGSPDGNNQAETDTYWSTTEGTTTYSYTPGQWGVTLTPTIINAADFGVRLQGAIDAPDTSTTASVDNVTIKVIYTLNGEVRRTWVTTNVNNVETPIRQIDTGTSASLEYYNPQTDAWETLDEGYTPGYSMGNANYNYYTYYCNQKDYQRRWNGMCWSTSTYADSAYSRVDLSTSAVSALGFLSAGSVVLDGEELYYSSIDGTGLSGITFAGAHDGAVGVAQLPTSAGEAPASDGGWVSASNNLPYGEIMHEMDAQMFVAGADGVSGNIVYYSAVDEPTNYTISATPGGGGSARYPETTGSVNALTDFDSVLTVMKENTIRKLKFTEIADGTAGSVEIVERENINTGIKIGAINQKGIARVENATVNVAPSGWVKSLVKSYDDPLIEELSLNIRPTVEKYDFSNASSIYFGGKLYIACCDTTQDYNNIVLAWDYFFKSWTKYTGWNVGDWFVYNNQLYYGASDEIACYKAQVTFSDDDTPYETYWESKQFDFGLPSEQKNLNMVYIEGYATSATEIGVSAIFDNDTSSIIHKSIDGSDTDYVISSDTITVLDQNAWGQGSTGGLSAANEYTLSKFRWYGKYSSDSFYQMQIKCGSNAADNVYRITHIIPYLKAVPGKKVSPTRIV